MNVASLIEGYGEKTVLALGGLLIGALFGFFAQRSKFCLRSATLEFWHRKFGEKISVWLLTFSAAVVGIQLVIRTGHMDTSAARQIAATGRHFWRFDWWLAVWFRNDSDQRLRKSAAGSFSQWQSAGFVVGANIYSDCTGCADRGTISLARDYQRLVDR
jgi:hypothetical protein